MTHYHYGQNIPGYMPMSDEPNTAATFEDAKAALIDDMERVADFYAMSDENDPRNEEMLASISTAQQDVSACDSHRHHSVTVYAASDQPHDLGLAFWVTACAEDECTADDEGAVLPIFEDRNTAALIAQVDDAISDRDWLKSMMAKHGHGGV